MIQALGWALVHFLWQGAALAVLFAVANRMLRRSSANVRYVAGCVTLALMLAAPVATFFRLSHPSAVQTSFGFAPAAQNLAAVVPPATSPVPPSGETPWLPLLVAAWATGVAILSVRMAGGLLVARRLRLRATPVASREWRKRLERLAARLHLRRGVTLCESVLAEVPMAIGWLRPVILLPAGALLRLSPEQMEAILAHELAHVRRLDYLVNLAQAAVETLLFYHPAVWWMGRRLRAERENCCDDLAVSLCGDAVVYARALVELETLAGHAPQMALAATGGSLLGRVKRLLPAERVARRNPGTGLAAVLVVAALATAWFCAQPMLHAANAATGAETAAWTATGQSGRESATNQSTGARQTRATATATAQKPAAGAAQKGGDSYIDEMAKAGYPNLSADDLVALKMQGVTPEYARQIRAAGFAPSARLLVAMRTTGVTADYAKQMKAAFPEITAGELIACRTQGVDPQTASQLSRMGLGKLNVHQVIAARVQGVTADYVRVLKAEGFADLTMNQVIGARVQGVTPEYVRGLKSEGFTNLTMNQVIGAKVQGVTPEYVHVLKSEGFTNLTMNQVIGARVQGVTPDFVRGLKAAGFTNLTMNEVIGARVQGVTPEFVSGLKTAGFSNLTINQAIAARVQGLTPEYVGSLKGLGFPNLTFDEALRAKVTGLTPEFVRQARQHGFQNLTIDKLIELKNTGVLSPQQ